MVNRTVNHYTCKVVGKKDSDIKSLIFNHFTLVVILNWNANTSISMNLRNLTRVSVHSSICTSTLSHLCNIC